MPDLVGGPARQQAPWAQPAHAAEPARHRRTHARHAGLCCQADVRTGVAAAAVRRVGSGVRLVTCRQRVVSLL